MAKDIFNGDSDTLLSGTSGNDSIRNTGNDVTIAGGKGADTIWNDHGAANVSINAGAGNDSIHNIGPNVTISGGAGNDSIWIDRYYHVTISGDAGNDIVSLAGSSKNNVIKYAAGDVNDTIYGFDSNDTLSISGGSYSTQASGNDLLVKVGKETITLKNAYALTDTIHINKKSIKLKNKTVQLSKSEDIIVKRNSVSVVGSAGKDSIFTNANQVTMTGGKGKDFISLNSSADNPPYQIRGR